MRIFGHKLENGVASLYYFDMRTFTQYDLDDFVILQPTAHAWTIKVTRLRNLIRVHIQVRMIFPLTNDPLSDVSIPLSFYNAVDHELYVLETLQPLFKIA